MNMVMEAQGVEPQYVGGLRVTDSGERWSPKLTLSLCGCVCVCVCVSRCLSAKCARTWRNCTQASITANLRPCISTTCLTLALRICCFAFYHRRCSCTWCGPAGTITATSSDLVAHARSRYCSRCAPTKFSVGAWPATQVFLEANLQLVDALEQAGTRARSITSGAHVGCR